MSTLMVYISDSVSKQLLYLILTKILFCLFKLNRINAVQNLQMKNSFQKINFRENLTSGKYVFEEM